MGHAILGFYPLFLIQGTLNKDTVLYHTFPCSRFKEMIKDRKLYFRKVSRWTDTYEYPVRFMPEDRKDRMKNGLFGFCLTEKYDKEAMWKLYSGDDEYGVCIKTTVSSIYSALKGSIKGPNDFYNNAFIGRVLYVPYLDDDPSQMFECTEKREYPDYMYPAFIKREAFDYEEEVRIIFFDMLFRDHIFDNGLSLKLSTLNFIDEIILSPYCTEENINEIKSFCKEYDIVASIRQSELLKRIDEDSVPLPCEDKVYWGRPQGAYEIT